MRWALAVFLVVLIGYAASYPSARDEDEENDLDFELRSILNHLEDEQMTRALDDDSESDSDENYQMAKRQGGHNIVDQQSKCEITCIGSERNPPRGKGKTVKEAAKICKNKCKLDTKKRGGKQFNSAKSPKRSFESESSDDDDQQQQRREFFDYLKEQLEQNNDKK